MTKFFTCLALVWSFIVGAAPVTSAPSFPLRLSPGWRVDVVAEAPAISAPSVVCCSPDGRIFLGQDLMDMGSPTDKPGDRILCIHPDGKISVFATNLYAVFGLQYIDGKLYVHHTPKFSVFDDDHSVGVNRIDLIASDNPHPWLPSFNDHIPSGFKLAMDGYFYISTGDKGIYGAVGTDGRKLQMRGGIYRMRPDGTGLEVYTTGTRNHLDIAINAEDEMFTYDNTDDGGGWWKRQTHMVDGGYYGYPYDFKPRKPYTLWMMTDWNSGGGAPTGALCYNEDALPQEYHGNIFEGDWACATVCRVPLKRTGSTYEAVGRVNFHKNGDPDFLSPGGNQLIRPVGITVTPDGKGFYVTDWGLPGWKNSTVAGRLLKLTYTNETFAKPKPKWFIPAATGQKFKASTGELVHALSHPAQSVRMVAQRRLADRHWAGEKKLLSLLKDTGAPPYARWSAIWTLDAIDGGTKDRNAIIAALQDKDPTVQAQAARELGTRRAREAIGPLMVMLDNSTNEALRFRAATALGRIGDRAATMSLRVALAQTDLFARYAAFKALNRIGLADPGAWPQIVDGIASVRPAIREGTYFALRETYDLGLVRALSDFLTNSTIPTEPRTNVLNLLSSLYQKTPPWNGDWWSTMPVNGSPPAKSENWEGSPVVAAAMRDALQDAAPSMREIAFDWVRTSHDINAASMLRGMFEHETNIAMRARIVHALPSLSDTNSRAVVAPLLADPRTPLPLLQAAVEVTVSLGGSDWNSDMIRLSKNPPNDQILSQLIQFFGKNKVTETAPMIGQQLASSNSTMRQTAVTALTQIGGNAAIMQFLPGLDDKSEAIRRQSIESLGALKAKQALPKLIKLTKDAALATSAIQALTRIPDMSALDIYLDGLASKNAALRSQCRTAVTTLRDAALPKIEAELTSTNGLPDDTVATLKDIYQTSAAAKKGPLFKVRIKLIPITEYQSFAIAHSGEAWHGRKIFTDVNGVNCIRCHRINGLGALIGPELTGLGLKQTRSQIVESILYPSKVILDGYQQVNFHMKDDDDIAGIVRSETTGTVTVIDSLGATNILQKSKIKVRRTSKVSLMPEGLQTGLSLQEFTDLVAFLENPNATAPPNRPMPVAAREENVRPSAKPAPSDALDFLNLPALPLDEATPPLRPARSRRFGRPLSAVRADNSGGPPRPPLPPVPFPKTPH